MALRYDDVLGRFLQACEEFSGFAAFPRACVVRDLRGRVRLVVEGPPTGGAPDLDALAVALTAALGGWFLGPVLSTSGPRPEERRAAGNLLELARPWPDAWPQEYVDALGAPHPLTTNWRSLERVLSKQAWLDAEILATPWPTAGGRAPGIASFYSFKGGVGRTTSLAAVAWNLARQGKKVACVDLDLEAPGLAALLDVDEANGVADYLIEFAATGASNPGGLVKEADVHGHRLHVVTAGRLGRSHVEKLARLDYVNDVAGGPSPVDAGLRELLKAIRRDISPDYILVDARAGVHDLGGLALHGLAHVDVLVSRYNAQAVEGMRLILDSIGGRGSSGPRPQIVVAQTFLPNDQAFSADLQNRFSAALYPLFSGRVYPSGAPPAIDDRSAPHRPYPIPQLPGLDTAYRLQDVELAVLSHTSFESLTSRVVDRVSAWS